MNNSRRFFWELVNILKNIIKLPFVLLILLPIALIGFFMTDWNSSEDRENYRKAIKDLIW